MAIFKEASKNGTLDHKGHPGLLNPKGHIGFLGHGSVVKFKNIRLKAMSPKPKTKRVHPEQIYPKRSFRAGDVALF